MLIKIISFAAISLLITLGIALGLILSQRPGKLSGEGGLDFEQTLARDLGTARALTSIPMRDSYALQVRSYPIPHSDAPLVVLVHGSGWHGLQFDPLAQKLSKIAQVIVPDLRGHGMAPGRRGDVDYIGQLEDDLADLITTSQGPNQKLVLGGHSSGGGLVVRFAGGQYAQMLDGAVLLAPFLKHNAPTTRANSGGWAQVLTRRIIGLSMLNTLRIRALNHLTIIQFAMPIKALAGPLGNTATTAYSYRLNTSYAPRGDYLGDIAGLPSFMLIAGRADEAFFADRFAPTMAAVTDKGQYEIVPDVGHLDIIDAPQTQTLIEGFLNEL